MCKKVLGLREPNQNLKKQVKFNKKDPFNAIFLEFFDYFWNDFTEYTTSARLVYLKIIQLNEPSSSLKLSKIF